MRLLGREKVLAEMNRLAPEITAALAEAQLKVAQDLAKKIRSVAPMRTGTYRSSIIGDLISNHPQKKLVGGGIGLPKDPHATGIFASYLWRWLEFGTIRQKAQPHIFPVYRARKPYILRKLRLTVNNALKARLRGTSSGGGGTA
jgi:HK97 gp10 family phage protein